MAMNGLELVPALALLAVATRELMWIAGLFILVSGIDDLAVDLVWIWGRAGKRAGGPVPETRLGAVPARRHAVLVPAWDESAVIGAMLRRFLATQDHGSYQLFVGVYPNDAPTAAAVEAVGDPRITMVSTGHPGPTTKADCLNALWAGMCAFEAASATVFDSVVLHDAEDVVHSHELQLFDYWLQYLAMVQVPVLPLVDPSSRWVSGHYLDEFAQNHGKDMVVRALLGTPMPSAGVGTAFSRAALARIAGSDGPFDPTSLTEDYEIGHRLHRLGLRGALIRAEHQGVLIATHEYFPAALEGAVRQKARWLVGIALAGWDRIGWHGPAQTRWMLLRDRKAVLTAGLAMAGYAILALGLGQAAVRALVAEQADVVLPLLLGGAEQHWLRLLLIANAVLLGWRVLVGAFFTARTHGWREGIRAVPRAVVANGINALAAARALERYRQALLEDRAPDWEKTRHRFPDSLAADAGHG
jgi:adsorption protein B